ncbi:hypothetical protein HDA40_004213 [Hamadaea flava]|uniref:DUF4230 domain-containing protein n=1 Tax=Hamadaea flava TaxID=1742688 RepID=A0ABV8LHR1_9ACTN|nr:DUF4230 domain-containing protein [Hamadaea flava]MCP2325706.1 hypothetical protein [Hamadaea flava]
MSDDPTHGVTAGEPLGRAARSAVGQAEPDTEVLPGPPGPAYILEPRSSGFGRKVFWFLMIVGLGAVAVLGLNLTGLLPEFHNPFAKQTVVKQQPPLLISIKDLSRFVAAEGEFQVVIDLKKDRKYVPDFLVNDRVLYVAYGTVQAYVEFGTLSDKAILQDDEKKTVKITLPGPQLEQPHLDLGRSYAFAEERGLFNRVGDFFDGDTNRQQEVMVLAEQKLGEAATASELKQRAENNTRAMLTGMMRSLGYTATVEFSNA